MQSDFDTAALALSGIQHYWKLTEASGTSAADSQGSTTLTYGADVSGFLTTGPDGTAQVPVNNGSTNRVAINSTGFAPPATATYFWWQRQDVDATDDAMIFELANSATFTHFVQADYNNSTASLAGGLSSKAIASIAYGSSANTSYYDKGTTGTWYFYCLTIDPSLAAASQITVYRNGVLVSTSDSPANSLNGQTPATMKVGVLGRNNNGTRALPIKAAACGFGLTNTVLSTGTMTSLYNSMITATKSGSDTGTGSDASSVSGSSGPGSSSDSGTGADATSLLLVTPRSTGSSTTLAADDFTGSAGRLSAHTPTGTGASGTWSDDGSTVHARLSGSGDVFCSFSSGTPQTSHACYHSQSVTDGSVSCDCIVQASGTGYVELNFRTDGTNNNRYQAVFDCGGNVGAGRVELYKVISGTQTQLGSTYNSGSAWTGTHSFKIEAIGTTVTVYVDGVSVISVTDSSRTSGTASITINSSDASSATVGVHADNFVIADGTATIATPADSAAGSDSSSVAVTSTTLHKGHPNTDTSFVAVATIQQGTGSNQELFPAMCLKNDGTLLRISRVGTSHLSTDGNLVAETSSDNGVTWGSRTTILNTAADLRAGIPRLLANGKIMVALWSTDWSGAQPQHTTYTMLSTDATATAWGTPVALTTHTSGNGAACESGVVEMANGDLLLPTYESETADGTGGWSTALYKSTNGGTSWTFFVYVARSSSSAAPPQALYEEPFLLRLFNGDLLCCIRQSDQGWTAGTLRYAHIWRSTDSGSTWADEGAIFTSFLSASRNALFQTKDGAVVWQGRITATGTGASKQGAYAVSDDNGDTWGTLRNLEDGTATASATSPPVYSYGDITQLANGKLAQIWVDETPLSGSTPAIRFATFTLTGAEAQDSGTGTEGISNVVITTNPVSASQTGTGTETSSVSITVALVSKSASDAGAFSESSNVQATVLFAAISASQTGSAIEVAVVNGPGPAYTLRNTAATLIDKTTTGGFIDKTTTGDVLDRSLVPI